ncbi:interleukin-6 receptor subunit alpha isoform X1 [Tamandua tetradactyla]|uniref:interleukin-6 receptor subunit alpha isoform X1 n=1 Tax=Tamandua tetradactyla TaxID=48850 RepID=UPI0040542199
MLAAGCALLFALLAARGAALAPGDCPAPELASDVLTSLPGASVTLSCPDADVGDNGTVHWVLRSGGAGSAPGRRAGLGGRLLLRSVQPGDSGDYSCFRAGRPAGRVRLLVDVPPEEPQLSCFRKSPLSKVHCEWGPRNTPSSRTTALLLVRKFQNVLVEDFQEPCQYLQEPQKFSCQLAVPEGDSSFYVVSLCVANSAGSKASRAQTFESYEIRASAFAASPPTSCFLLFSFNPPYRRRRGDGRGRVAGVGELVPFGLHPPGGLVWQEGALPSCVREGSGARGGIPPRWLRGLPGSRLYTMAAAAAAAQESCFPPTVQPDPPVNLSVTPVVRNPRWLRVTWQDPPSWNSHFYRLRFEIRYRAERSKTFTTWMVRELQHHCIIHDAWSGRRHVVQLRAQEEFGHGLWSEWSQEVLGTPWTEPESPRAEPPVPASAQAPTTDEEDGHILSRDSANATSLPVQDSSPASLPTFLVAGGSLAFGSLLCIGVILRFKKRWKLSALKEGKTRVQPQPYALGQLVPERPKPTPGLVPLISPPVSPCSLGSDHTSGHSQPEARAPRSPYDVSNRDYFLPR